MSAPNVDLQRATLSAMGVPNVAAMSDDEVLDRIARMNRAVELIAERLTATFEIVGRQLGPILHAIEAAAADEPLDSPHDAAKLGIRLRASVARSLPKLADIAVEARGHGHPAIADEIASVAGDLKRAKDGMP